MSLSSESEVLTELMEPVVLSALETGLVALVGQRSEAVAAVPSLSYSSPVFLSAH